jgi:TatD DNase family protein
MLFPLFGRTPGVRLALGLHPLDVVKVDLARELDLFARYASHTSYIGEVGLDFSPERRGSRLAQEEALDAMLAVPGVPDKVMTLHSRGAAGAVIERVCALGARRAILHWYSGSLADLAVGLEAGLYFSINPAMTRSAKGRKIIKNLPPDRALVESDGPYAHLDGRAVEPRDIWSVVEHLAREWNRTRDETVAQLATNLHEITAGLSRASTE